MDLGLREKNAIVCGSSRGIGNGIARELAKEGVNLVINSRETDQLIKEKFYIEEKYKVKVIAVPGDISDMKTTEELYKQCINEYGKIDILVNNCGGPPPKSYREIDEDEWYKYFELLLMSSIRMTKLATPSMVEQKWGRIITIGSTIMREPTSKMVLSATLRAATATFMKSISSELAEYNITVNTISTGGVKTGRLISLFEESAKSEGIGLNESLERAANSIPIKRFAEVEEFVQGIIFLCSTKSSYITGECLSIDGGLLKSSY